MTYDIAGNPDSRYLDVYVLSMPAFVWFKAETSSLVRRAYHTCQVIGKRQMLVIGGINPTHNSSDGSYWDGGADPWAHGLGLFDMSALSWTTSYNASAKDYEQPAMVKQYYADQ